MKTVTAQLAAKMNNAGWQPKKSTFWWVRHDSDFKLYYEGQDIPLPLKEIYAAPTAEETLERLPSEIQKDGHYYSISISKTKINHFWIDYRYYSKYRIFHLKPSDLKADYGIFSLAEAAGKMYIYLKENNLLKEEVGKDQ